MTATLGMGVQARILKATAGILIAFQVLSAADMFMDDRPGFISAAAVLLALAVFYRRLLRQFVQRENSWFVAYVLITFASILNYVYDPVVLAFTARYPDTLVQTFSYLILPSIFFFLAGSAVGGKEVLRDRLLDLIVWINVGCITAGLILYVVRPDFYMTFLLRALENSLLLLPRMSGYLANSMIMGAICSCTLPLIARTSRPAWQRGVMMIICLIGSVVTLQRGSLGASVVVLLCLLALHVRAVGLGRILARRALLLSVLVPLALGGIVVLWKTDYISAGLTLFAELSTRDLTFGDLLTDRTEQWVNIGSLLSDHPLGIGIGMLSHVTASVGFELAIPDGNYFRILGELGPMGLLAFLGMVYGAIARAYRSGQVSLALAIGTFAIQGAGTNVFDFYYSGYLFWLFVGLAYARRSEATNAQVSASPSSN